MAKPPRIKAPKSSRPRTNRKRRKSGIVGDIAEGVLGALGGLFGGGLSRGAPLSASAAAAGMGAGSRGTGKANYGPLPAFSVQSKSVTKYNNPSLAVVSLQMTELLQQMGMIESTLMEQFSQQQYIYKENARTQREINTESRGVGFVPFVSPAGDGAQLGALSIKQLNNSFLQFSKALDDAAEVLNNMDCSCDGSDLDIDIPFLPDQKRRGRTKGGRAARNARLVEAGKANRFISPKDALNSKGLVKPGYEPVFNKRTGAVAGYKKAAGWGGEWARRASTFGEGFGRAAERVSGGINATGRAITSNVINPVTNFASRTSQYIKGLGTRGATSISQSAITKRASEVFKQGVAAAKRFGAAAKSGIKATGRIILSKGLTLIYVATEAWNAYQEIKALPADLTPSQRKNAIAKIVGRTVANIGLVWSGAAFGMLVGTAVIPGPGTLVGLLSGIVGGFAADYLFGNSVDAIVNNIIDALYPADKEVAKKVPAARKEAPMPSPMAASAQGEGSVPYRKPSAATKTSIDTALKTAPKDTVGMLMNDTAMRVGVDPSLMHLIASDNTAFDPKKQIRSVNGSEIFKLTPQQWSYITSQYGPKYPELYAGINDPKAATTAGALLIKDSQEFLNKNSIPATPLSIYGSYLFGNEGIRKLLNSQPSDIASTVLPEAAQAKPELFKDQAGDITAGTLVQKLYNKSLPEKQKIARPQNTPAIPPTQTPKVAGLNTQQPSSTPSGSMAAPTGGNGGSGGASPSTPSPSATPTGASDATMASPSAGKEPAGSMTTSSPVQQTAQPVPPSPTVASGAAVSEKTRELEKKVQEVQTGTEQPVVIQTSSGKRAPAVLPSKRAGYTGTGNVPDPTYIFMDQYEYQFRYRSSPVLSTAQTSWV